MSKIYHGNPYTHEEYCRENVNNNDKKLTCDWCGNNKKVLFKYNNDKHIFCNKDCFKNYHM